MAGGRCSASCCLPVVSRPVAWLVTRPWCREAPRGLLRLLRSRTPGIEWQKIPSHCGRTGSPRGRGRRALLVALDPSECWRLAASRSVTHPTRLETRTKESNMCASQWVSNKPRGAMKAKVGLDVDCVGIFPPSRGRRTNDPSCPIYRLGGV
ncbi:hypothetical protein CDAR_293541 [Caerostris darwini]|uniref:Uncharacterized protein n=1 Tax=Caerostris darwini TaxID=1538125 RepID=A0AAV4R0B8_9ARAC|nr:hypothetical protein CDAR_293541 [Caerostris darwini]